MEQRGERGALATCRHVFAAEVGNRTDASQQRDGIGVANLLSKAILTKWVMLDGLSMAANGQDFLIGYLAFSE